MVRITILIELFNPVFTFHAVEKRQRRNRIGEDIFVLIYARRKTIRVPAAYMRMFGFIIAMIRYKLFGTKYFAFLSL